MRKQLLVNSERHKVTLDTRKTHTPKTVSKIVVECSLTNTKHDIAHIIISYMNMNNKIEIDNQWGKGRNVWVFYTLCYTYTYTYTYTYAYTHTHTHMHIRIRIRICISGWVVSDISYFIFTNSVIVAIKCMFTVVYIQLLGLHEIGFSPFSDMLDFCFHYDCTIYDLCK